MKPKLYLLIGLAAIFLAGCVGRALPGKIYSLDDAVVMPFEIETSYGTGDMRATNPKTGEKFTGQYTGTTSGGGYTYGTVTNQQTGQSANVSAYSPPTSANARGVLIGDKGTVIEVFLDIKPGVRPKGHGEGRDNQGRRYQVQF
jgi:hypothetical protein